MARNESLSDALPRDEDPEEARLGSLVAEYLGRLMDGERLDRARVVAEHPEFGEKVLVELEAFIRLREARDTEGPLGTFGDYTLRRQIGRGGMGVVYEAWETSMERAVALKLLPVAVAADDRAFQRFLQEAKTAGKLSHQNIVPVFSTGIKEGTPWFSMEYVEGETLARILARTRDAQSEADTPFGPKYRQDYFIRLGAAFAEVADALQHAHSRGVIHRDMKPSNLILDTDGRLRILDFGLASLEGQESLTLSGDVVGTPLYMSPEQARRKKIAVDHRTDVYSLGATMYQALTGTPPFRGKDHNDTLSQIIEREPVGPRKVNPRVPKDLETIVLKCLRKDAADRFGTAEALSQDLCRFVRGDAIEARAQPRLERWLRRTRRHWPRLLAGALFASLVALVAWLGLRQIEESRLVAEERYEEVTRRAAMVAHLGRLAGGGRAGPVRPVLLFEPQDLAAISSGEVQPVAATVEELERVEKLLPSRFEAPYHRARLLQQLGRSHEARTALRRSLALRPGFVPAEFLLAQIDRTAVPGSKPPTDGWGFYWVSAHEAYLQKRFEDVARSYHELLRIQVQTGDELYLGSSIEIQLGHGLALLEASDPFGASLDFAAAVDRWPAFREPWLLLASACYRSGRRDRAQEVFERFYGQASSRDEAAYWIVATSRVLGDYSGALRWTDKIERVALREQVRSALFLCTYRFADARDAAERAIVAAPDDALSHSLLAASLVYHSGLRGSEARERICRQALAAAQRARDLRPESAGVRAILALSLQGNHQHEAAEQALAEAFALAPDEALPWFFAGEVSLLEGCHVQAEQRYRKAAEIFRAAGLANEEAVARAQVAEMLRSRGLHRRAFEACRAAVAVFPENRGQSRLGALLSWWLDEDESAVEFYRQSLEFCPSDAVGWSRLAEALHKSGKIAEARDAINEALRIEPEFDEGLSIRGVMELDAGDPSVAIGLQVKAVRLRGRALDFSSRKLASVLLRPRAPGGDPRLDPLADSVDSLFSSLRERRDPARALLLLHARAGGDLDRAYALAKRVNGEVPPRGGDGHYAHAYSLAALALVEHARGDRIQAVRTLERALSDPQAPRHLEDVLRHWRGDLSGELISYETVEACGPEAFEAAAAGLLESAGNFALPTGGEALVALFVRALAHERGGRAEEAETAYRALVQLDPDPASAEPRLGVFRALLLQGKALEAEAYLREWLLDVKVDERDAWEAWITLCYTQLALEPDEVFERLVAGLSDVEEGVEEEPGYFADLCWSLQRLGKGADGVRQLRILAGADDGRSFDGVRWSRDRFCVGGRGALGPGVPGSEAVLEEARYAHVRRFDADALDRQTQKHGYRIPVPRGRYRATVWMAALDCDSQEGVRRLRVEGQPPEHCAPIELELDPELVRACRLSVEVSVVDGLLEIEFLKRLPSHNVAALEIEVIDP